MSEQKQKECDPYQEIIDIHLNSSQIVVYSKTTCVYSKRIIECIRKLNIEPLVIQLDHHDNGIELQDALLDRTGILMVPTIPSIWVNKKYIGGFDDTYGIIKAGLFLNTLTI